VPDRETFTTRTATLLTMIGVAVGLGNVWRFPYMVGRFGGASFVLLYAFAVLLLGVPCLIAEWSLGRHTRRGPVGAFAALGVPGGKVLGWIFFFGVAAATAYYTNAVGWVLFHALGEALRALGGSAWAPDLLLASGAVLPPETGFDGTSFTLQIAMSGLIIGACAAVLVRGLRQGIEKVSRWLVPMLFGSLLILIVRAVTLPGAGAGVAWYLGLEHLTTGARLSFPPLSPSVVMAALGQAFFSLSLGGTFMVVYGSYLPAGEDLAPSAFWTAAGDLGAGLLAGFAILPAVFALGLTPASGPGLLFSTLPRVFAGMPLGGLFGFLFFGALAGAAFLSDIAAFEVLVAALVDNTTLSRGRAVAAVATLVGLLALPPMINLGIFVPWDLTFGSGFQTLGALLAVVALVWWGRRATVLAELGGGDRPARRGLYLWLRWVVPAVILLVALWWLATEVLGVG